jgi:hypothetical protein
MKIKWTKNHMKQDEASYGPKFGTLWMSFDLDDMKAGYVFISEGLVVTKKTKTKAIAKARAEKWLRS